MNKLSSIFYRPISELPDFMFKSRVIYRIKNTIDNKSYIGQAVNIIQRMITNDRGILLSHKCCYENQLQNDSGRYLYRALVKYGLDNFELEVLEYDVDDLNSREKYWIKELHTCIYDPNCMGYNMTWGGEDASQLHTSTANKNRVESNINNHNGVMSFNTPEAKDKSLETRIKIYGNKSGRLSDPEVRARSLSTTASKYNGDCCGQMHTKSSQDKALLSRASKYNGDAYGQLHTSEARVKAKRTELERFNGKKAFNTDSARYNRKVTMTKRTYNVMVDICTRFMNDGGQLFDFQSYWSYKGTLPGPSFNDRITRFFSNCIEVGIECNWMINLFPIKLTKDLTPTTIEKQSDND